MYFFGLDIGSLSCDAVKLDEKKHIVLIDNSHRAIAARTNSLVKRVAKNTDGLAVSMPGGVARNKGVVKAVAEHRKGKHT